MPKPLPDLLFKLISPIEVLEWTHVRPLSTKSGRSESRTAGVAATTSSAGQTGESIRANCVPGVSVRRGYGALASGRTASKDDWRDLVRQGAASRARASDRRCVAPGEQ